MKVLGPATDDEMVLAFLRAEIDSVRFSPFYRAVLAQLGRTRTELIDHADLADGEANAVRAHLLGEFRGFRRHSLLFRGFPDVVEWRRVQIELSDHRRLRYANYPTWITLSGGTRRVVDGARSVRSVQTEASEHILTVAGLVAGGATFPELIAIEGNNGDLVLMEGHTRATAYALVQSVCPTAALICSQTDAPNWAFY